MAHDQLTRIEEKLDDVVAGQATLGQGQVTLIGRVTALEHGQATLVGKVTALEQGQATFAHGLEEVQTHLMRVDNRLATVDTRLDKLEVHFEVMHDDIKQIAEGHAVTQAAIAKSTETVVAHIDRKIEPIERAVRALFGSRS